MCPLYVPQIGKKTDSRRQSVTRTHTLREREREREERERERRGWGGGREGERGREGDRVWSIPF